MFNTYITLSVTPYGYVEHKLKERDTVTYYI